MDSAAKYHLLEDVLKPKIKEEEEKEVKKAAGAIAGIVGDFWNDMTKASWYI